MRKYGIPQVGRFRIALPIWGMNYKIDTQHFLILFGSDNFENVIFRKFMNFARICNKK